MNVQLNVSQRVLRLCVENQVVPRLTQRPLQLPALLAQKRSIICQAGFGKSTRGVKKSGKKISKIAKYLDVQEPSVSSDAQDSDGWFKVPDVSVKNTFVSKPIKAIILESGKAICLFKVESTIYCTDANSTAFKYPLADASIIQLKSGEPAVEVKLDGTVYELATGRVVSWCPKNNPVRSVLGSLKDKSEPEDLPTYPVDIRGDDVWVNLSLPGSSQ